MHLLFAVTNCVGPSCDTNFPTVGATSDTLQVALQILFGIIGTLTVIYIIFAGIRLTTSQGDPQTIAKERQSIIFALVGLVVTLSAEIIVTFVLGRL
jgi:threonine/homoserine/homoserine lactone efflux protein